MSSEFELQSALAAGKEPVRCPRCGWLNYMKLLPKMEDVVKANGARYVNANPHNIDLRNIPTGWRVATWNCGRARCTAFNYALSFIPPLKEMPQPRVEAPVMVKEVIKEVFLIICRSCGHHSPQGTTKCPNCGASL